VGSRAHLINPSDLAFGVGSSRRVACMSCRGDRFTLWHTAWSINRCLSTSPKWFGLCARKASSKALITRHNSIQTIIRCLGRAQVRLDVISRGG
jgi:hypothetical protein